MATKNSDGCFQKAGEDEELFTLLARDESAPILVELWAFIRSQKEGFTPQVQEALECANRMREWRKRNRK